MGKLKNRVAVRYLHGRSEGCNWVKMLITGHKSGISKYGILFLKQFYRSLDSSGSNGIIGIYKSTDFSFSQINKLTFSDAYAGIFIIFKNLNLESPEMISRILFFSFSEEASSRITASQSVYVC